MLGQSPSTVDVTIEAEDNHKLEEIFKSEVWIRNIQTRVTLELNPIQTGREGEIKDESEQNKGWTFAKKALVGETYLHTTTIVVRLKGKVRIFKVISPTDHRPVAVYETCQLYP